MSNYLPGETSRKDPIRLGMVGGGKDAFIGAVHRIAARLDDHYAFVAGALSSTPERARESGRLLGLAEDRAYTDFHHMAECEAKREDGVEAVSIVTPNNLHAAPAITFLKHGIHVICDKPLTATLDEARSLAAAARKSDGLFVLTHNYTGYPLVRQARDVVATGGIGEIRAVHVEYATDWLAELVEAEGLKQAEWRTDPDRAGSGCIGDIGTHAYNLMRFVTGLKVAELSADMATLVSGRGIDDHVQVQLHFDGGARGHLWASQVAIGAENGLRLRVFGSEGALDWSQETPNVLYHAKPGEATRMITRMGGGTTDPSHRVSRIPAGLPEGYLEAFANIYSEAAAAIFARRDGREPDPRVTYPTLIDGLDGMAFIEACAQSSRKNGEWVTPINLSQ